LNLGAFTTINHEIETTQCYDLACGVTIECRYGGVISKDGNCEHKLKYELCGLWQKVKGIGDTKRREDRPGNFLAGRRYYWFVYSQEMF